MFKIDAMKWLIENVTKWPTYEHGITSAPNGWSWCELMLGMELVKNEPTEMYVDMHIGKNEWLNGTDVEPMSRSDAFDWLYNAFRFSMGNWPKVGIDCRTMSRPGEWSWTIPTTNKVILSGTRAELVGPPNVDCENITFDQINKYILDETIDTMKSSIGVKKLPIYYIAGPMTGYDNSNRPAFNNAAKTLSMTGHVLNPATLPDGLAQRDYMSICLPMVQCATHMFMLKGWEKSPGALAAHGLAVKLKLVITHE